MQEKINELRKRKEKIEKAGGEDKIEESHKKGKLTEALLHPTQNQDKKDNYKEYLSLLDKNLLEKLQNEL